MTERVILVDMFDLNLVFILNFLLYGLVFDFVKWGKGSDGGVGIRKEIIREYLLSWRFKIEKI